MPSIDIMRIDESPHETVNGIRDDTASRGVDLEGAQITAIYADGSTETLRWRALDAYTYGGATGTDVDMTFGFDWHELAATKLLASLQINLQPANSVFDTTFDSDDQSGGSTPGSLSGFPFELAPEYESIAGSLTVHYSGIVSISGNEAVGDLYTTMVVDFTNLPAGGLLGDLRWNSDIDTMRVSGDLFSSNQGNDTLVGGAGNDTLDGGQGTDTADYLSAQGDVRVNLSITGSQSVGASQGSDTLISIENLSGSRFNDILIGSADANMVAGHEGDDRISGLAGNDILKGGLGNDTLTGGLGNDTMDGGAGIDWVSFTGESRPARLDLSVTGPQTTGHGVDVIRNIENIHGGAGNDLLLGNAGANLIRGGNGADNIQGRQGYDLLEGNAGNDILNGGLGNDTLDGGAGVDWVSFMGESRAARLDLSMTGPQATGHGVDVIRNIENIHGGGGNDLLLGNAGANLIRGGNGADNIHGQQGYDLLEGNAGNDILNGGLGNDTMDGGVGIDWVSFMGESRAARLDLSVTGPQATGHGVDVIRNIENIYGGAGNDLLLGNAGANLIRGGNGADNIQGRQGYDLLEGNAGNDSLNGGFGNDTLDGGVGNDRIRGGIGTDTFVFKNGFDCDVILDFQDNIDTIRLLDFGVANFAQARTYATASGSDVVFDFGDGDTLKIHNTTINALGNDLLFV